MKITIDIPDSKIRRIKKMLKRLEIPRSFIIPSLKDMYPGNCDDEGLWFPFYVYPDRQTAGRIAKRLLGDDGRLVELCFLESGKELSAVFYPAHAQKLLDQGKQIQYWVSKFKGQSGWKVVEQARAA